VTDIWCAPETLTRVRDYVTRTLGQGKRAID
jgi:hypothetical protein